MTFSSYFAIWMLPAGGLSFRNGRAQTYSQCPYCSVPMAQGFGGPCCARILTAWFASKERGTYWGMWNIAHNLGGFSAPVCLLSPHLTATLIESSLLLKTTV